MCVKKDLALLIAHAKQLVFEVVRHFPAPFPKACAISEQCQVRRCLDRGYLDSINYVAAALLVQYGPPL